MNKLKIKFKLLVLTSFLCGFLSTGVDALPVSINNVSMTSAGRDTIKVSLRNASTMQIMPQAIQLIHMDKVIAGVADTVIWENQEIRNYTIVIPGDLWIVNGGDYIVKVVGYCIHPEDGSRETVYSNLTYHHSWVGPTTFNFDLFELQSYGKYFLEAVLINTGNHPIVSFSYNLKLVSNGQSIATGTGTNEDFFSGEIRFGINIPQDMTVKAIPNDQIVNGLDPESYVLDVTVNGEMAGQNLTKSFPNPHKWTTVPNEPIIDPLQTIYTSETVNNFIIKNVRLYKYQLDGGTWSSWMSARSDQLELTVVPNQSHTINVLGIDDNDNATGQATYSWVVSTLLAKPNKGYNYVYTQVINKPIKTDFELLSLIADGDLNQSVTYFDPMGRKLQNISIQGSKSKKDVIIPYEYAADGKQVRDYLPYVSTTSNGDFNSNAVVAQNQYYLGEGYDGARKMAKTNFPFSETIYEKSSLNRALISGAPGEEWQPVYRPKVYRKNLITWNYPQFSGLASGINQTFTWPADHIISLNMVIGMGSTATEKFGIPGNSDLNQKSIKNANFFYNWSGAVTITFADGSTKIYTYSNETSNYKSYSLEQDKTQQIISVKVQISSIAVTALDPNGETVVNSKTNLYVTITGDHWGNSMATEVHPIKTAYSINQANEARLFTVDAAGNLVNGGFYSSGKITSKIVTDENGNKSWVFTDISGKDIMKRSQNMVDGVLTDIETYYVYNSDGSLCYIIPPMAVKELKDNNWVLTERIKSLWLTEFRYDDQGRVVYKKIPEADPIYTVYDKLGRVVMTQDGNLRENNQWLFTKYDLFGRTILTGIYSSPTAETKESLTQTYLNQTYYYESTAYSQTGSTLAKNQGYTAVVFPTTHFEILTVNYYDDYTFPADDASLKVFDGAFGYNTSCFNRLKNKVISSKTRVLGRSLLSYERKQTLNQPSPEYNLIYIKADSITLANGFRSVPGQTIRIGSAMTTDPATATSTWTSSVSFYDQYGRVIQTRSTNVKGGQEITASEYDFAGKTLRVKHQHQVPGNTLVTTIQRMTYDHAGRVIDTYHKVNTNPETEIAKARYNELGQSVEKNLCAQNGSQVFLQSVDYAYNIRGWLTHINNRWLNNDGVFNDDYSNNVDAFGMELNYQEGYSELGATALYNGNITAVRWQTLNNTGGENAYAYTYDKIGQLTNARHAVYAGSAWDTQNKFSVSGMKYDLNGNILAMKTNGVTPTNLVKAMDDLAYYYNGNRLSVVTDAVPTGDFITDFEGSSQNNVNNVNESETALDVNFETPSDLQKFTTPSQAVLSLKPASGGDGNGQVLTLENLSVSKQPSVIALSASKITITPGIAYKLTGKVATNGYSAAVGVRWYSDEQTLVQVREDLLSVNLYTTPAFTLNLIAPATAKYAKLIGKVNNTISGTENIRLDNLKLEARRVYDFDNNGNMVADGNKGMVVHYNMLNLPDVVDFGNGNRIVWTYSVGGAEVAKQVYTAGVLTEAGITLAELNTKTECSSSSRIPKAG